jgi:ankyrin repeat protein
VKLTGRWRYLAIALVLLAGAVVVAVETAPLVRAHVALWRRGLPLTDHATAVRAASRSDDVELLALLADAGIDLGVLGAGGETPLHAAAAGSAPRAAAFLLSRGVAVDGGRPGPSPISLALEAGHHDTVRVLLEHGAAVAPLGPRGRPPVVHVAATGDARTMGLLLGAGIDPNLADTDGLTALAHAASRGDEPMARLLLEAGASPDVDPAGPDRSLLEQAIREGRTPVVELLLAHGADPAALSREGQPLVPLAVALGRADVTAALLDAGADVDMPLVPGASEEFLALVPGKYGRYYLTRDEGLTPLMVAVMRGDLDLVRLLLARGGSLGPTRKLFKYPLGLAANRRDIPMMQVLLGRDPEEAARSRKIVISLAQQRATLYENEEATLQTRVSTGRKGFRTPTGEYVITDKHRHWRSTIYEASMPYFMRLSGSDVGLHQGVVPRGPASHGCIRLPPAAARTLYARMRLGDPVTIVP